MAMALTGAFLAHSRGDGPTPAAPLNRPQVSLTFRKQHRRADTALENDQGALGLARRLHARLIEGRDRRTGQRDRREGRAL